MTADQNSRPDAPDVARRALILKLQFIHSVMSPPLEVVSRMRANWSRKDLEQFIEKMDEGRARLIDKMRADGLWEDTSPSERQFFEASVERVTHQQRVNASWRLESIHCLAWSLGLISHIPPYDTKTDPEKLLGLIPVEPAEFIRSARLRPESEISSARDVAELWHWRSRTRQLQEQGYRPKTGHTSLDAIVREVAPRAAADGTIPTPIDGDFPALGRAYRDLSANEWALLQSIALERHFALNWLSGYAPGGEWDATPTET